MSDDRAVLRLDLTWTAGPLRKPVERELFALLEAIRATGKLTSAASRVGLPYRQAWGLIARWSDLIGRPLVAKEQGRGTRLTPLGERLVWLRARIEARLSPHLESAASEVEQQLAGMLDAPQPSLCLYASHDLVLAELRDLLRARTGPKLDVRFMGSLDSVIALCKGRCEMAGFHVPEDGLGGAVAAAYQPWLKPRLQRLVCFVKRRQGMMVAPGNPKGIRAIEDIARTKARFINRQRGSGTRLAVERLLEERGIDRGEIVGFHSEEFTHLAVAAAVASGMADVGFGIEAAASRLRLQFIPLFVEDYYFLVRKEALEQDSVAALIEVLKGAAFRSLVGGIPGYDAALSGTVRTIDEAG